ncbi:hypothetical protein Cme02nite_70760 [Catellatospora methionotrophica]|uniref:Uncharacterized protein n=1 Tax=Catellatospora methionotrophica TaxID=121620 RepID=A0A8J3LND6_9ACTN|nr:hypothetical protein [Catellatospora methionotrophica]GIG18744.1 hypothetical protein Cme02nite_70760 [Catellatospora methionotrophica]
MTADTTDQPRLNASHRVGLLLRLTRWTAAFLRGPEPQAPPERTSARSRLPISISVPAQGHAFHFRIHATFRWQGETMHQDELTALAQETATAVRRELTEIALDLGPKYPPHRAHDLEVELNRAANSTRHWQYELQGKRYRCRPILRVELDDRVKQHVEEYWHRRVQMECEHEAEIRRTELAQELSARWLGVLEQLTSHRFAAAAARLTEAELAEVITTIVTEQKDAVERLQTLLDSTLRNSSDLGAYERAEALDVLLEQLRQQASSSAVPKTTGAS